MLFSFDYSTTPILPMVHRARRFLEEFGRQPGIVLSDIDPVYLNAFFPDWIVAAPLDGQHRYKFSRIWRYGPPRLWRLSSAVCMKAMRFTPCSCPGETWKKKWCACRTLTAMSGS